MDKEDPYTENLEMEEEPTVSSSPASDSQQVQIGQDDKDSPLPGVMLLAVIIGIIIILIIGGVLIVLSKNSSKKPSNTVVINTQSLDAGTLSKLKSQNNADGTVTTQLSIDPATLFKNGVSVQGGTTLGRDLFVVGTSNLQGVVSTGSNVSIRGDLSVGGKVTASSLSIGTLNTNTIKLNGDFNVAGHLVPSGSTPSIRRSLASSGGSATINGNDTAGTITITIGSGALQTGEMAIINFRTPFALTPKIQITPIDGSSASLNYFATRTTTFFTINTASMPASGATYNFDYLVTQ